MKENFFNIIIPTKNRLPTLQYALKTALDQEYGNYAIIISDNNSSDGTGEFIKSLDSLKINYYNTGVNLSMSSNFEFALSKTTDGFIVVIGDDDGLLPGAIKNLNNLINKENVLAISSRTVIYTWPGDVTPPNLLLVPPAHAGCSIRSSEESIKNVIAGRTDYNFLPTLYTGGVVHSSLVEKARDDKGIFYHSLTPDAYSGFAITSVAEKFLRCNAPFAIMGASRFSNGQSSFGLSSNKSAAEDFYQSNDIPFLPSLGNGKIKSIQIITLEAYLQSAFLRDNTEEPNRKKQFELAIAKATKGHRTDVIRYLKENCAYTLPSDLSGKLYLSLLIAKFRFHALSDRVVKFLFWDTIPVIGKFQNVYEVSQFVGKTKITIMKKLYYKIMKIKKRF